MKKKSLVIVVPILLLFLPIDSAGFFDFLTGMFAINQEEKPPTEGEPSPYVYEQVKCVFTGSTSSQMCSAPDIQQSCQGTDSCTMTIYGTSGSQVNIKACVGGAAYATIDGVDETVGFKCEQPAEKVSEQVECVFLESKQMQRCYSEFGQTCEGETSCVIDIIGEKGRRTALKSTCGGYAYIIIDGNNENAEFKCIPREEVAPEQIIGKGFQRAYWQCYDGAESQVSDAGCLPSEVWHKKAEVYCDGHCYQDGSKCGVNSFSISEECYEAVPQVQPVELEKVKEEMNKKLEKDALAYVYAKDCPYCEGMEDEVDKAAKELNIQVSKIDRDQSASSMGIVPYSFVYGNAVPLLLFAKGEKEGGFKIYARPGKTDAQTIIQWVKDIYAGNVKPQEPVDLEKLKEEMEESKEETLFCKDSCPLDGKCYPFGYRKKGMFCSDEGMFKEQLKAEETCDNNFECSSNVCIDSKCVSAGAIRKFFEWFKGIFG
ncbi:MAG: thioredoxin family protein [Nanoarchaeota archaeon]|nr:thioredoxin family protein [Nanoarchaeota archaeon]